MCKSKIAVKLSVNFAVALLIFSIVIGSVFVILFRNHTINIHKAELENRASTIANTLSSFMDSSNGMGGGMSGGMSGYGAYMRFIGDIAGTDIWIVDKDLNLITGGMGQGFMSDRYKYTDLPENAEELIDQVFTGKTAFSEDFSSVLSESTLTVGAPIISSWGDVEGVVLLHSPVYGINNAISQGITILGISILTALIISVSLSVIFSYSFTKPLSIMNNNALLLASGDYTVKNNIKQKDEIGQLADTLDVLAERLGSASRESAKLEQMRRDFVANVSHELKTPVTVMRGSLEAIVENVVTDPAKIQDYHIQMLNEAKFLQRLVGDLLDLSRLQNTDFIIEKSEISICDIINDVTRSATQLAETKNISIKINKNTESCNIMGDYGRLRQMLLIVLDNAVKFSPPDGVIEVNFENNRLSVKDEGQGIASEHLPYIFDRFYKSRTEENKTGTGLGLAIAKQIADRHGIILTAQSKEGQGAEFIFNL